MPDSTVDGSNRPTIDDRDQVSKAAFALALATTQLDFARQHPAAGPFLTLPVGR